MKISHRLTALSTAGVLALVTVGAIGLYCVRSVQERFEALTSHTVPLNNALLELQQSRERTLVELLELSQSASENEATAAREQVRGELTSMAAIAKRIDALDEGRRIDLQAFENALGEVDDMVAVRLGGTALFREAAGTARASLHDVDEQVEKVSSGIARIVETANRAAKEAQQELDRLVAAQRGAREAQSLLGDMIVLAYATDALSSKFRLSPLRERFTAAIEALERDAEASDPSEPLTAAMPDTERLRSAFADESSGLFAQRLAALEGSSGARRAYRKARTELETILDESAQALNLLIGELEFAIVLERRAIDAALELSGDPASIAGTSQRLALGARDLGARFERLLLARDDGELDTAHASADTTLDALIALSGRLAIGLEKTRRADLQKAANDVGTALEQTRRSIESANEGLQRKFDSESDVAETLIALGEIAERQRTVGAREVAEITSAVNGVSALVERQVHTATWIIVALCAAAILISIVLSLITIRSIVGRLRQALAVADKVSQGRLDPVVKGGRRDEISQVLDAMDRMVSTLDGSVRQIRSATVRVNAGAEQISAGSGDLSDRTEQQANRLGETADTTSRIGDIVREGAKRAERADELSRTASEVAGRGRHAVNEAMRSMRDIEDGAREISSISAVIDSIAFQTNILALNAAVEASRAGESGRGFAVVASEVGSLAQKSKESVLQIRQIIDKNVEHVESGSTLVAQAERHMEEVVGRVDEVVSLIGEVSSSNRRQVEQITRIDDSVGNLGQMTRQNAELSERTTGAARDLLEQSRTLDDSVSVFTLSGESRR